MDPISLAIGAVGLGLQIFGGAKQAQASHEASQISQDQARQEQSINDLKLKQMELEGRRTQLENIRNIQRARAMATNASVTQGANLGSGIQGGLAQISDQGDFNMQGVNQALEIGRGIAGYNQNITQDKIRMAGVQSDAATAQGISTLGGAVMKAGPIVGQLSQGFGNFFKVGGGGNYSGTPGALNTGGLY